ncbi:MAG: DUF3592 domain-containing protein [Chloroflexota bacterium]
MREKPTPFIPFYDRHQNHPGFRIVGSILLIFVIFVAAILVLETTFDDTLIRLFGVETQGTIVRKWAEGSADQSNNQYYVFFEYDVAQQHFQRQRPVSLPVFRQLREGDLVAIKYLRTAPATATLSESRLDPNLILILVLGVLGIVISIVNVRVGMQLLNRERTFKELGSVLLGKITQTGGVKYGKTWHNAEIRYQFVSPRGRSITGSAYKTSLPLKKEEIPPVGTRIAVLYVNDQLFHIL